MDKATSPKVLKTKDKGVDIRKIAMLIENTLDSLGITARVVEINQNEKDIDFNLEIALGTPLESVVRLHKDIAMAIASPTGDVEIIAPIPGRSLVGIKVPLGKFANSNKAGKYKVIRIQTERIVYKGLLPQLKYLFVDLLKLIVRLLNLFISYLSN